MLQDCGQGPCCRTVGKARVAGLWAGPVLQGAPVAVSPRQLLRAATVLRAQAFVLRSHKELALLVFRRLGQSYPAQHCGRAQQLPR